MIESPHNETFRRFLSLTTSKGLKTEGIFLLSGEKLIAEFLENPSLKIVSEILAPGHVPLCDTNYSVTVSYPLFDQLDVVGTHYNILVLEQPAISVIDSPVMAPYSPSGIELVAPLGDPGNLGALIRSCEAFAVPRVILTREAAHPFLPKTVKASAGSVLRVPLSRGPSLSDFPSSCIALDVEGTSLYEFSWPQNGLLVIGEEGPGFSSHHFTTRIRIPTAGVESLNVVVAASIALSYLPGARSTL